MAGRRARTKQAPLIVVAVIALLAGACGDDGGPADGAGRGPADQAASTGASTGLDTVALQPLGDSGDSGSSGSSDGLTLASVIDGGPAVVNFFASWCQPCIEEMPAFEAVHQDLGDRVGFVGLATSDREGRALELVDETGVTFPTYADPNGDALAHFEAVGMPTTVFVSGDGEVLEVHGGELDETELRDRLDEHFSVT